MFNLFASEYSFELNFIYSELNLFSALNFFFFFNWETYFYCFSFNFILNTVLNNNNCVMSDCESDWNIKILPNYTKIHERNESSSLHCRWHVNKTYRNLISFFYTTIPISWIANLSWICKIYVITMELGTQNEFLVHYHYEYLSTLPSYINNKLFTM